VTLSAGAKTGKNGLAAKSANEMDGRQQVHSASDFYDQVAVPRLYPFGL
jgi:hypothetical protein